MWVRPPEALVGDHHAGRCCTTEITSTRPGSRRWVLRLLGQVRKPARKHPLDQVEELPVGAEPNRRLRDRERDQLRVCRKRRATPRRDRILVREDIGCNNKGLSSRAPISSGQKD